MKGKKRSAENKAKISKSMLKLWQDPAFARAQVQAFGMRPNHLESEVQAAIKQFGFVYVGDGQLAVGGKVPDFWNGDHKIVEVYGDYWHAGQNPQDRIDLFKAQGYDCLVVWEHEWQEDPAAVVERVREFSAASI